MQLLKFLKAPLLSRTQPTETEIEESYSYWRWRIFIGMYIGYVFYYFSRNSFGSIKPLLGQDLGFSMSDLGILTTIFAASYGLSKFISGVLSDRSNPRIFMSSGLIITGILNILFGCSSSLLTLSILWCLNGLFQGWGWPPCAKLLTHWYSQKERGLWWGMQNSSHNVGAALIPLLIGMTAQQFGWRHGMFAAGVLSIIVGIFIFFILRDTPSTMGLPSIETFKKNTDPRALSQEHEISLKELLFKYILNNSYLWVLGIAYFFIYLIRGAINDWAPMFLMETRGYQLVTANGATFWFEVGGLIGSLFAGWASDRLFKEKRGPVNVIFSCLMLLSIMALWALPPIALLMDYLLIFIVGFFVFGPQMLIGMVAVELSHKKAAGGATGFIGFIAYLGMASSGYPLTKMVEAFGWSGFFEALMICSILCILLLLPFWSIKNHPNHGLTKKVSRGSASV
ncbi:putative hexose phosphate transport protein [Rhabdochlamydiaceae symbiont of Dictyostelium giganteum]